MSDSTEQGSPEATKAIPPTPPEVSKASIRKEVWDHFEDNDLANFPRPVHNRIPNFKDANAAAEKVKDLEVFKEANTIKINPDKPQQHCRFLTLEASKTLLVPTPRLRTGLFNKIVPPAGAGKEELHICSTSQGIRDFSTKLGLDAEVKVDLVIVGSVAVSKQGFRIGKGEGFADLEYAMMVAMKAVNKDTVIVTTVHDCQVRDIPESLVEEHDITVDYIVTPTEVIKTECKRPKPPGIIWSKLDREKFRKVPILKKLREMERAEGKDVTLRDGETGEIPTEDESEGKENQGERPRRRGDRGQGRGARGGRGGGGYMRNRRRRPRTNSGRSVDGGQEGESGRSEDEGGEPRPPRQGGRGGGGPRDGPRRGPQRQRRAKRSHDPSVYIGGIPRNLRVSDFKTEIHGREVMPIRVVWHGGSGHAFLQFQNVGEAEAAVDVLKDLEMKGKTMKVELARSNTAPPGKEGSGLESGGESGNAKEKLVDSAGGDQD